MLERIKGLADKSETTLAQLERELRLGNGTIRRWESSPPSVDKLQRVAEYFNVSIDFLLGHEDINSKCNSCYVAGLSDDEKLELLNYAQFLRNKKAK